MRNIVNIVQSQVIASVKDEQDSKMAIQADSNIVFLITRNLVTTNIYVDQIKEAKQTTFIHIDFIDGLSSSRAAIKYIADGWKPKGIITTRSHLIKFAKEEG